jgi:ketosteroid isomerase-like protein
MRILAGDAALLTYKTTIDGSCGGEKVPAHSWAASLYVRDSDRWKAVFHSESPVVDPAAPSAKPAGHKEAPEANKGAAQDAGTEAMFAVERFVREDWRKHDSKKLAKLMTSDISFINIFGEYLRTKADASKNWSGTGCDIKSVGFRARRARCYSLRSVP